MGNSVFHNRIGREESHAHSDDYSDGPPKDQYLSDLDENVEVVAIVDHISPKSLRDQYFEVGRDERYFIEGTDISSRNRDLIDYRENLEGPEIMVGAEIDTYPGIHWSRQVIENNSETLDVVHLSHHYPPEEEGMRAVKDGDFTDFSDPVSVYFEMIDSTLDMLENIEVDMPVVIAHPGLLENNVSIQYDELLLREEYRHVLDRIAALPGVYPELNLKTEERTNCGSVGELESMLQDGSDFERTIWAEELMDSDQGYTVGSDVHRTGETETRLELAHEILEPSEVERAVPVDTVVKTTQAQQP